MKSKSRSAILVLEDGSAFQGRSFGADGETCGEVVFNTSMSGYQEILSDPSYYEQIITMTYPLIGNYGINKNDIEAIKPRALGFIVKEACSYPSNWRSEFFLSEYLNRHGVIGLEGVDTRMITRKLRTQGALRGIISTRDLNVKNLMRKLKAYPGLVDRDIVKDVTTRKKFVWEKGSLNYWTGSERNGLKRRYRIVCYDFGIKHSILRQLYDRGFQVLVVPAQTTAAEVLKLKPDGIFLSNGPGDPAAVTYAIEAVKKLLGIKPIFGICLGHQILGLALGAKTYKLKFGHHGGNHPVKNLLTNKVEITSQNHGFAVDPKTFPDLNLEITHVNLYDQTLEGFRHKKLKVFSVQYHPEASPGPHDSRYLFDDFVKMIEKNKNGKRG